MISKTSIIIFSFLLALSLCQICPNPQKTFYLSYDAIGNRQYLAQLFQNISLSLPQYEVKYTDKNGSIYQILNLQPHYYYNSHRQIQQYSTQYSVNVTLGQLYLVYRFNFKIQHQNKNVTGWARGRTLLEQYKFTKKIVLVDGALHWDIDTLEPLLAYSQLSVQYSDPQFTINQSQIITQMLNDHLGDNKIKQAIMAKSNQEFAKGLKYHLNHQELLQTGNIIYKYNEITLNFTNIVKEFKMSNTVTKGLQVFMQFGLDSVSPSCNDLPSEFDQQSYGGVQQIISMGAIKQAVIQAINQGLFNLNLDKNYQVPYFQFYMGDLGNFVDYANKLPASDPFTVNCTFSRQKSNQFKILRYADHQIYLTIPQQCRIIYQNSAIIKSTFDMNIVVNLVAQQNYINVDFKRVGVFADKYQALNPNFVVTDAYIAKYAITAILQGFIGKKVFGTKFPTFYRKYPALKIFDDKIILFDPAEK